MQTVCMFNLFLLFLIKLLLLLLYLPKPCTDRFGHVNGKQPMLSLYGGFICKTRRAGCVLTVVFLLSEEHICKNGEGVYLSKLRHLKPISPFFFTTV